jgi:hypothetical protein
MAIFWRSTQGFAHGVALTIGGHPWFKWIDAAIELPEMQEVLNETYRRVFNIEPPVIRDP